MDFIGSLAAIVAFMTHTSRCGNLQPVESFLSFYLVGVAYDIIQVCTIPSDNN